MCFYIYIFRIYIHISFLGICFFVIVWHQINVVEYILIMSSSMLHFSQSLSHQVKDLFCRLETQSFPLIFMNSIPWVPKWQHKHSILSSVERQHKKSEIITNEIPRRKKCHKKFIFWNVAAALKSQTNKKLATKLRANVEFQIEFERRANKDNGK